MRLSRLLSTVVLLGSSLAFAAPATQPADKPYPLTTCVVSGEKLGEMAPPVTINYEGREVRFCCSGCVPKFKESPAEYLKKLDDAQAAADKSATDKSAGK